MDDEELSPEQLTELRHDLVVLQAELSAALDSTRREAAPVQLDSPIGRLSRMDAIQQQQMAKANRTLSHLRLKQVKAALVAADAHRYGYCRRCEEPIGFARLKAKPETPFCIACQSRSER